MKKRTLSLVMAVILLFSLLPTTVFAAGETGTLDLMLPTKTEYKEGESFEVSVRMKADAGLGSFIHCALNGDFRRSRHVVGVQFVHGGSLFQVEDDELAFTVEKGCAASRLDGKPERLTVGHLIGHLYQRGGRCRL